MVDVDFVFVVCGRGPSPIMSHPVYRRPGKPPSQAKPQLFVAHAKRLFQMECELDVDRAACLISSCYDHERGSFHMAAKLEPALVSMSACEVHSRASSSAPSGVPISSSCSHRELCGEPFFLGARMSGNRMRGGGSLSRMADSAGRHRAHSSSGAFAGPLRRSCISTGLRLLDLGAVRKGAGLRRSGVLRPHPRARGSGGPGVEPAAGVRGAG